jgi:hypothetical protein
LFADALDPVSGFVIERMHEDWSERYSPVGLEAPADPLREYLESPTSRLLGSGYREARICGPAW